MTSNGPKRWSSAELMWHILESHGVEVSADDLREDLEPDRVILERMHRKLHRDSDDQDKPQSRR